MNEINLSYSNSPASGSHKGMVEPPGSTLSHNDVLPFPLVSIVIPARNEELHIKKVVQSIFLQQCKGAEIEVIVVDDGSTDGTAQAARSAGATVLELNSKGARGNPAAARNRGAAISSGDPIIFLDADCIVADGWLKAILEGHANETTVVGGALALPPELPIMARCDYYCGWYLIHPERAAGYVPHHPPPNISVRREAFLSTSGFAETPPFEYTNEERFWLAELHRSGHRIYFEPRAVAHHYNKPGFLNMLRRNYRWGYTAIESKSQTGAARMAWLYRYPTLLIAFSPLLAVAHTVYILACWLRAGRFEPLLMSPFVLASRVAYSAGMAVGGIKWVHYRSTGASGARPRSRWG